MSIVKDEKELLRDSPVSSLNEIAYQLAGLYERWAVEHQHVARREAEMARLLESFEGTLEHLDSAGEKLHGVIKQTTKEAAVMVGEITGKSLRESCREYLREHFQTQLDPLIRNFKNLVERTEKNLKPYESVKKDAFLERWLTAIIVGVVTGVLVAMLALFLLR